MLAKYDLLWRELTRPAYVNVFGKAFLDSWIFQQSATRRVLCLYASREIQHYSLN